MFHIYHPCILVPHFGQNFESGEISHPQFVQNTFFIEILLPHSGQNFAFAVINALHVGHEIFSVILFGTF